MPKRTDLKSILILEQGLLSLGKLVSLTIQARKRCAL